MRSTAPAARRCRIHAPAPTTYPSTGRSISTTKGAARITSTTSRYRTGASGSEVTEAAVDNPGPGNEAGEDAGDEQRRERVDRGPDPRTDRRADHDHREQQHPGPGRARRRLPRAAHRRGVGGREARA